MEKIWNKEGMCHATSLTKANLPLGHSSWH